MLEKKPFKTHHRHSIRLKEYDYSQEGAYFVTIATQNQKCLFGEIIDEKSILNDAGKIVKKCWNDIPKHFPYVQLDKFIIMPNHIHGIFLITSDNEKNHIALTTRPHGTSKTVGSIIRGLKIGVTKWMHINTKIQNVWLRNYYEHIIRNNADMLRIQKYIENNPAQWDTDHEKP